VTEDARRVCLQDRKCSDLALRRANSQITEEVVATFATRYCFPSYPCRKFIPPCSANLALGEEVGATAHSRFTALECLTFKTSVSSSLAPVTAADARCQRSVHVLVDPFRTNWKQPSSEKGKQRTQRYCLSTCQLSIPVSLTRRRQQLSFPNLVGLRTRHVP
jgi:hypothetical protein